MEMKIWVFRVALVFIWLQ